MIGVVNHSKIFEFRDEGDLVNALDWYADKYGSDIVFIVDTADKIKAIIKNGSWLFMPDLTDETKYYIYGTTSRSSIIVDDIQKNDYLPNSIRDWQLGPVPFIYVSQRVPKDLDF